MINLTTIVAGVAAWVAVRFVVGLAGIDPETWGAETRSSLERTVAI